MSWQDEALPCAPQDEAGLTRKFETSHVKGATCRTPPIPRSALEKDPRPGPFFEGNPVGEGTTRRGTATPVHVCVVPGWCWVSPCPAAPPSARPPPGHCAPVRAGSAAVLVALVGLWRVALAPLPGIHPPPALKEQVFTSGQQRWPWVQFFKRCFIRLLTLSEPCISGYA